MSDSSLFPSGADYKNLAGRLQAKIFVVDDTVIPSQAGWITIEALIASMAGVGAGGGGTSTPSVVLDFSDGSTALFSDGTPVTFSDGETIIAASVTFSDGTAAFFSDGSPITFNS